MERIRLSETLSFSRIAAGFWRLMDWNMSLSTLEKFIHSLLEMGITTFDHADIYGDYSCEAEFGKVLKHHPGLRDKMQLVTKCGIKLRSDKFPGTGVNHYDTSYDHIVASAEQSLRNLHTEQIDLLLIHRPDPLMDFAEIARAFFQLRSSGKVLNFGVSNFNPLQYDALNKHFARKLVTNQVEYSPYCLESFQNGNMDFFMRERIHPMAWSPVAQGRLFNPSDEKGKRVAGVLWEIAEECTLDDISPLIYAWILYHPAGIIPIVGSGRIERVKDAVDALQIKLTREQWYRIYVASMGEPLP
ncbi:MAG: aldo/keto reductase [bacterium]|jgi:predicted oxidoreductase